MLGGSSVAPIPSAHPWNIPQSIVSVGQRGFEARSGGFVIFQRPTPSSGGFGIFQDPGIYCPPKVIRDGIERRFRVDFRKMLFMEMVVQPWHSIHGSAGFPNLINSTKEDHEGMKYPVELERKTGMKQAFSSMDLTLTVSQNWPGFAQVLKEFQLTPWQNAFGFFHSIHP